MVNVDFNMNNSQISKSSGIVNKIMEGNVNIQNIKLAGVYWHRPH